MHSHLNLTKKILPWIVSVALFMETLDITIISTAIPVMGNDLGVDAIELKFALTCYLLTLAIFIPISGWLADKFGTRNIFCIALFTFILSSAFCGLSTNLYQLICARIFQGLGGALMMPIGRLTLLKTFSKSELVNATNYVTIPSLTGPALGPVLGGIIVTYLSWPWIFLINVPIGILGLFLAFKYMPNYKAEKSTEFDTFGFILLGCGLATFSFIFESIQESYLSPMGLALGLAISIIFLIIYIFHYKKTDNPVFDFEVFKIGTFRITVLGSLCSRLGIGGMSFLLSLFLQIGFNNTALSSGFLIFPYAAAMFIMKFFVKRILRVFGFKTTLIFNTLLLGLSVISFSCLSASTSDYLTIILIFIHGLLTSLQFSCMNVLSYVDLGPEILSKGTSIASVIQQLSMSFGVAISALVLEVLIRWYPTQELYNYMPAFQHTFVILGIITTLSTLIFLNLRSDDGKQASEHIPRARYRNG